MSKEDIEKAVRDAEMHASEDKKAKEAVETKNAAESLIFQSEKALGELGDKVSDAEKQPVLDAIAKLKETVKATTPTPSRPTRRRCRSRSTRSRRSCTSSRARRRATQARSRAARRARTAFTTPNSPTRPTTTNKYYER